MSNRLSVENSPYLLQHADNPVDWYPWGPEALKKAQDEHKPIFLSIGYAACHWCHVMAHESFEDTGTAAIMNEHFVSIKVDREQRPDLDSIYMNAVVSMTGQGGWPLSVFLTPQGQPFFGGTYFPPARRYNMPSFSEVLLTVVRLWQEDRQRLLDSAQEITLHLQNAQAANLNPGSIDPSLPEQATMRLAQTYDWQYGGWGKAPKFPQPMAIEFLLRRAAGGDQLALDVATHALDAMSLGGMYDILGGGFSRYSTDDYWLVPHFEKMLYDNAQLARVYLHAYLITRNEMYRRVCEETLDFLIREMMSGRNTGFYSSLDADSEGEEGKFYLWTLEEIRSVLSRSQAAAESAHNPDWADFFITAYDVTGQGNFEGRVVLQRSLGDDVLAEQFDMPVQEVDSLLSHLRRLLLDARSQRIRPGVDDKILVAWNALAVETLAEAARYLSRPDYLEVSRQTASFLLRELHPADRLLRSWRAGHAQHNAYLEDYAALILALIALYQSDPAPDWFRSALDLTHEMLDHFSDPAGGFFDTRDDHDPLVMRPKDMQDNATPSGNSLAALALLEMAHYMGSSEWFGVAELAVGLVSGSLLRYSLGFGKWLCAFDDIINPPKEIAILYPKSLQQPLPLVDALWSAFRPDCLAAISAYPPHPTAPPLLYNRPLLDNKPTAYVCRNFVCLQPVNTPTDLLAQLNNSSTIKE